MKRFMAAAIILLTLLLCAAGAEALVHVSDLAGKLTPQQQADLQSQAEELFQASGFDVILHTTNDSLGKSPMDYSFDYYHSFRDAALYPDGALFAVMFDTRDFYEAARGKGIPLLTHREANDLGNVVRQVFQWRPADHA